MIEMDCSMYEESIFWAFDFTQIQISAEIQNMVFITRECIYVTITFLYGFQFSIEPSLIL